MIADCANELKIRAYLVGGYVRDQLLKRASKDIDVAAVGSGINLAEMVASQIQPQPVVTVYKNFGTALLKHENFEIEFVILIQKA